MRTECSMDRGGWEGRSAPWIMAACVAAVVLFGCSRESPPARRDAAAGPTAEVGPSEATAPESLPPGQPAAIKPSELYAAHCAACHGERGDGQGVASAYLFPRPRDFRAGRFRLVSTSNNVPTREDLHAVLLRGMPGSAMPPWEHLSQAERDALVDEVMRLRREGAREGYIGLLKEEDELTDEEIAAEDVQQDIQEYVDEFSTPGESTTVPTIGPAMDEAIARGKVVYANFACIQCHGETGRGDGVQAMVDEEGLPTRPRDFTIGIFKGNHDVASLYRRVAYGMPGTPMPASAGMTPEQMVDLVHYMLSLSTEEQRQAAILNRTRIVASRVGTIPDSVQEDAWAQIEPTPLRMTPLWWRDDAETDLTVQAVHDGQAIAVRLTWKDATVDRHANRSEAFEDAVAMELFRGKSEPFLGMGDAASPVDVWFWDADRQAGIVADEALYPNAVVDVYPFSETVVAGAEMDRPGARISDQPDVSLPARATGNLIMPPGDESGGSSLHVGGPGSVTFRVPQSQLVRAHGTWSDGRWTVVMTRPLSAASQANGVSMEPGGRASVAFAVWDGSHQDRDGQKSITIWQDLELEQ